MTWRTDDFERLRPKGSRGERGKSAAVSHHAGSSLDRLSRAGFACFFARKRQRKPILSFHFRRLPSAFEAEADPEATTICNCTDCQTMSGAPLRAVIITHPGTFKLLSGTPTEYRKTADSGNVRLQAVSSSSCGNEAPQPCRLDDIGVLCTMLRGSSVRRNGNPHYDSGYSNAVRRS
jgi:hypothetical protein